MKALKLTLVLLCVGLLGLMGIVTSLPTPPKTAPDEQQVALTPAQNADPVQSSVSEWTVRPEIGGPVSGAIELARAGKHKQALARLETLRDVPAKTAREISVISQTLQYLRVQQTAKAERR